MAKYTNLSSLFTAIANAIRTKKGTTAEIIADNFPEEIADIETGADVSGVTAGTGDVLAGKYFVNDQGNLLMGSIATKSNSNLSVSGKTITGPAGYYSDGISKSISDGALSDSVTIDVDPRTGNITANSGVKTAGYLSTSKTTSGTKPLTTFNNSTAFTPGKTEQTIVNSGVYTLSPVKIAGDSDLDPANIKSGVSIFGVSGKLVVGNYTAIFVEDRDPYTNTQFRVACNADPLLSLYGTAYPKLVMITAYDAGTVDTDLGGVISLWMTLDDSGDITDGVAVSITDGTDEYDAYSSASCFTFKYATVSSTKMIQINATSAYTRRKFQLPSYHIVLLF